MRNWILFLIFNAVLAKETETSVFIWIVPTIVVFMLVCMIVAGVVMFSYSPTQRKIIKNNANILSDDLESGRFEGIDPKIWEIIQKKY